MSPSLCLDLSISTSLCDYLSVIYSYFSLSLSLHLPLCIYFRNGYVKKMEKVWIGEEEGRCQLILILSLPYPFTPLPLWFSLSPSLHSFHLSHISLSFLCLYFLISHSSSLFPSKAPSQSLFPSSSPPPLSPSLSSFLYHHLPLSLFVYFS